MTYQETIQYLYDSVPMFQKIGAGAYKEGLYNTNVMDEHFGHPHTKFKTIHIAGTNGKGSVSHSIASILQAEGYKVGLYTSPHLVDFRERIRINGRCVDEKCVIDFVEKEKDFFEPLHPSFFELTTAMAFKFFADAKIDIAVVEVGLGGRLDCTNIISPILSIITNISFDHTQFLGNTLEKIAGEKAGIIKQNTPVVIGETTEETRPVFIDKARQMDAPIFMAEDEQEIISATTDECNGLLYNTKTYGEIQGELGGIYQMKNTNTILCAMKRLKDMDMIHDTECIHKGLANVNETTGLTGRWQQIGSKPMVICDTGHNTGGWKYLSRQLKAQHYHHTHIVFGMVDDKDINTVMSMLPKDATYYYTRATTKRAIEQTKVKLIGDGLGLKGECFPDVKSAYDAAKKKASPDDFIFVGGSSYVVADFLTYCN